MLIGDRRSEHSFGLVVGGIQTGDVEKPQQMRTMFAQAFGEASILFVRQPALEGNELIQSGFEGTRSLGEGEGTQIRLFRFQSQRVRMPLNCSPRISITASLERFVRIA